MEMADLQAKKVTRFQKVQVWIHARTMRGVRKVLLLRTIEKRGNFWQPITGKVERGETPVMAALREAHEETGIQFVQKPRSLNYKFFFTTEEGSVAEEFCFALEIYQTRKIKLDPKEHVESKWVEVSEAMELLKFDTNREGLKRLGAR